MSMNESWRWHQYEWTKSFSEQQIRDINDRIESKYLDEVKDRGADWKNLSNVKIVAYSEIKSLLVPIVEHAYNIARYDFGYDVYPYDDEKTCNFNIYDSKDKADYAWHTDGCDLPFVDCKLTLIINLSTEPYEGGEFQLMQSKEEQTIKTLGIPGGALMFKSHILHRVLPVTSGIRKTLTIFINGPRFR